MTPERMVSHTAVGQVALQHPGTVVVMVVAIAVVEVEVVVVVVVEVYPGEHFEHVETLVVVVVVVVEVYPGVHFEHVGKLVVVVVVVEPVYTVLVTVNVVFAGHVSDDDGVQGGRVGVYH
jgi:hypothetical protein